MKSSPKLLTGDPSKACASFTRFVLPFAYELERFKTGTEPFQSPCYENGNVQDWLHHAMVDGMDSFDKERAEYLTSEIRQVLYQRTKWLVLGEKDLEPFELENTPSSPLRVYVRRAGLILMEWEREFARLSNHSDEKAGPLATGFLVLEAWYEGGLNLDALLVWNEITRYWKKPFESHLVNDNKKVAVLAGLKVPSTKGLSEPPVTGSVDHYFERWARWLEFPIHCPERDSCQGGLIRLMPKAWGEQARAELSIPAHRANGLPSWAIHADNRAHVWTCAVYADEGSAQVEADHSKAPTMADKVSRMVDPSDLEESAWLRLLNVDQPCSKMSRFEKEWLLPRTYQRWAHWGTLYGFTQHSGAMLTGECTEPPTWQHFRSIYFDQLVLLLYVRVTLFRFSQQLMRLTSELVDHRGRHEGPEMEKFAEAFGALQLEFAEFTNLYQFPLISHQQQAVEMYSMLRQQMDVEVFYEQISSEIQTTQQLMADRVANQQTRYGLWLTIVATLGLALSMGISILQDHNAALGTKFFMDMILLIPISFVAAAFLAGCLCWLNKEFRNHLRTKIKTRF